MSNKKNNPGWQHVPYGYMRTDEGLVIDPYQAKVVKLMADLMCAGVTSDEVDYLLPKFKVPKLKEEREIDFEKLEVEMLKLVQEWRLEEGRKPLELEF